MDYLTLQKFGSQTASLINIAKCVASCLCPAPITYVASYHLVDNAKMVNNCNVLPLRDHMLHDTKNLTHGVLWDQNLGGNYSMFVLRV